MRSAPLLVASAALVLAASGLNANSGADSSLNVDAAAAKNRPVSKVITLLKDMLKQLEKEASEDEEIYNKLACWCSTNDKGKTHSVAQAEARIQDLTSKLEEYSAGNGRLSTEIAGLEGEVEKNQQALDKATSIRQKQLGEFNDEERDLLQSISALKASITVLSKHHEPSLLQLSNKHASTIAATIQHAMKRHGELLEGAMSSSQKKAAMSFVQSQDLTLRQSYAPQSGEIYGILKQMKETFEANLAESQKEEQTNQQAFSELKSAKEEEISAGQSQVDAKQQELATGTEKNAQAQVDLDDTKRSLAADEQFLLMLKEKCQMTDKEWENRQRERQQEMEAVTKAIQVLAGDDAHDLFTRTFNPALLQAKAGLQHSSRREKAARLLSAVAQKVRNPRLAALAYRVKLDAFAKVKKAIDDMVAQLLRDKEDEIRQKDFCTDELNQNQLQTEKKQRQKQDLDQQVEDLELTIRTLNDDTAALKQEIADMQVQMKRAGEDREQENHQFQSTVADQRETERLLRAAHSVLSDFYGQQRPGFLQQPEEAAGPPPPPGLQAYKRSGGGSAVLGLLDQIISDAQAMEAEAIRSEEDAQKAYEDFVKETNSVVEAKSRELVNKAEEQATKESDLVEAKKGTEAVNLELEQLGNSNTELHQSCDFVLRNFEVRQTARDEEVQALQQAKAILSGANFQAFLQRA